MKISIITPSHNPAYLPDCHRSLLAQTHPDWEWIVIMNGGGQWSLAKPDSRITIYGAPETNGLIGIGGLKRWGCDRASGEIFVELDHDDLLHPQCLEKLAKTFTKHPDTGFVYSDTGRFRVGGLVENDHFGKYWGWAFDGTTLGKHSVDGSEIVLMPPCEAAIALPAQPYHYKSFEPTPQALSRIHFAPDHVRTWRRETYYAAGGHDGRHEISDDYGLMLRTYLLTEFHHIAEPLYYYRLGNNTCSGPMFAQNQEMQRNLSATYRSRIVETWARRKGLALLDICSHGNVASGYTGVDFDACPGEIKADLRERWPFEDGSVGVIRAQDALEHLPDKLHTMAEIHRVLAHGGWLLSETPSANGNGADMDPTHCSRWNEKGFWYLSREASRVFVPNYPKVPHFQIWDLYTHFFNSPWLERHNISYIHADLSAVKEGPRLPGAYDLESRYCG